MGTGIERVTYVGHATVLAEMCGVRVLTDPVLRRWVGPLRRHGAAPGDGVADGLDAVLISHLHRDHVDLASLRRIGRDMPLVVPPGAGGFFERHGFAAVTELAPGEALALPAASAGSGGVASGTGGGLDAGAAISGGRLDAGGVAVNRGLTVTAVEALHAGGRRGAPDARAVGYLLDASRRVYFAGDTDLFDGMAALGAERRIDLALLPVWGWGPNLGPGHLDPERAAQAAALLSPRIAVPIHWGTLYPRGLAPLRPRPLRSPPREFAARTHELAPQVAVRVLSPGEATSLS